MAIPNPKEWDAKFIVRSQTSLVVKVSNLTSDSVAV